MRAGFAQRKKAALREFIRCRLEHDGGPLSMIREAGRQGAGILSVVSRADKPVEMSRESAYAVQGGAAAAPERCPGMTGRPVAAAGNAWRTRRGGGR